ncbi:MAG: hypothetical protein ACLVKN_19375 [Flavonifractor plautii]
MVLDEATAYIDPENEAVVQQAGQAGGGNRSGHRPPPSTITADQIVVINGGRIQDAVPTRNF